MTVELLHDKEVMKLDDKIQLIGLISSEIKANAQISFKKLKDLQVFCKDHDDLVVKQALKSLAEVYIDILPSYKIRSGPNNEEQKLTLSKEVRKLNEYEGFLLNSYQSYL